MNWRPGSGGASACVIVVLIMMAGPAAGAAPGALALVELERHDVDVRVDGRLDEAVWSRLAVFDEFYITEPDTLQKPPYATRVRIFYSQRGLHVGVDMDQPAETLISRLSGRDVFPLSRDGVSFTLDTSGTGRYGYWFNVFLGNSISDGTILPERQYSSDWDGPWRAATAVTDSGWSAEFLIPWGTVAMPQSPQERRMGFYISRAVAHRGDERWAWPALPPTRPEFMSVMQPLQMEGISPRQQYNFYPYVSVTQDQIDDRTDIKTGADLFWRPSSNFQLNATLNPDFGAVESDEVIINLSATETFFPEKRLFFLEGQQIFNATPRSDTRSRGVGRAGSPYTMVNTRRIGGRPELPEGADDDEDRVNDRDLIQPVDLLGAAKVTGQIGAFRYGVLGAFEDDASLRYVDDAFVDQQVQQSGNDYGIARLLWESSSNGRYKGIGFLSTAVVKGVGEDAFAQGVDWHYYTRNAKLKMDGQAFTSDIDGIGRGYGGYTDFDYSHRQGVSTRVGLEYLDSRIELNDLGYLERNSEYQVRVSHQRTTSDLGWAKENQFDVRGPLQWNLDDRLVRAGVFLTNVLTLNSLHRIKVLASYSPKVYDDLNSFDNGIYRTEDKAGLNVGFETDPTQAFIFVADLGTFGEDLGGQSLELTAGVEWRPNDRFSMGLKVNYKDRDGWLLHQEDRNMTTFQAQQLGPLLDSEYWISAKQQLRISLQWVGIKAREDEFYLVPTSPDDLIEVAKPPGPTDDFSVSRLSFQARYRWEIAPLSDLFIVYTRQASKSNRLMDQDFDDIFQDGWDNPLADMFVVKLRYRLGS
ncbi:MAG: DUF5916 domain-containing protein [Pseudomonadales bacterium]|nr:hypothetical protein [Pseudomonadales bacterium]